MKNHELEQLFLQFRDAGDMRALARLFDAAAPQLLPVAVHLAARRDEADDLIQATFLTAIERAETYERGRAVLPWLLGILALHARKLRQKQGRVLELDRLRQPSEHDPEQHAASAEVRQAVDAACRSLPAAYSAIVQRHLIEGLEPLELAGEMGISNGAARVRLHRGMKLLRRALPPAFSSGAYAATSTRGVAAIREAVLERASMLTGSPIPAAGFAPLGLLLTFLLPFAIALPAWLAWHGHDGSAPEESVLAVTSSPIATSNEVSLADSPPLEIERVESTNAAESELIVHESNSRSSSNATVRGRLLLTGGVPAVGASVKLTGWSGNDERAREFGLPADWHDPEIQSADADGRFEFNFDPPRAFCFSMSADHASAAKASWFWYEVAPSSTIDLGDIALEPAATIVAHIVDAQSNPLSTGWTVDVDAPAPTAARGRMATSIHTKWIEGSQDFVIERVPARRVTIRAKTESVGRTQSKVTEVAAGQTTQVELRYTGPDLARRITVMTSTRPFYAWYDAGTFQISATRQGAAPIAANYDQGGVMAYLIDGCDPGSYDITVSDPHFVPWSKSNVQPGEIVRAKLVGNAALQLHIAGSDGAAYSGPYGLRGRFAKSNPFPTSSNEVVLVDPAAAPPPGNLISGMIPADYELTLEIPGQPAQRLSVVGMAPNQTRDVQCGAPTSLTLHGRVVASDGSTPVSGVDVQLTRGDLAGHTFGAGVMVSGPSGAVPNVHARATTDAQGEFAFSGLSGGKWTLRAAWGIYLCADRTIELGAQSEPVVIRQPPSGFLSGHLLVPAGAPLEDTSLLVRIETQERPHQPPQDDREHDELQSDGSFRFGPLPAGDVTLELQVMTAFTTPNGTTGSGIGIGTIHTATIHDGEEVQAEIDLRETFPGRLAVNVALDDHAASGGRIAWSREGSSQVSTDAEGGQEVSLDGTARLGAFKPGTIRITYVSDDKTWAWSVPQPIVILAGQEGSYALALHTTERDLRCVDLQGGAALANVEIEWRSGIGGEVLVAKARTDAAGRLHLRMPDQQIEIRCVGDSGTFTEVSWGAGTGPLNVSLRRAP